MDTIETLIDFGLTRQEAALYLVLSAEGELSGYEAAKLAGVSRSNAYAALAALTAKGAAYRLDGATPRYQALPPADFCAQRLRRLRDGADYLAEAVPVRRAAAEAYLTVEGADNVAGRLRAMVEGARERIYLALPPEILELARAELLAALARGVALTAIVDADPGLPGAALRLRRQAPGQVRLIVDSAEVLTGELGPGARASCLYSRRKQLVDLFKDALRNEIALIELGHAARD